MIIDGFFRDGVRIGVYIMLYFYWMTVFLFFLRFSGEGERVLVREGRKGYWFFLCSIVRRGVGVEVVFF